MDISTAVAFIIAGLLVSRHSALKHTCLALMRACSCTAARVMILSGLSSRPCQSKQKHNTSDINVAYRSSATALTQTRWKYRHIPGPPPSFPMGNVKAIKQKEVFRAHQDWSAQYGDICKVFMVRKPVILVTGKQFQSDLLQSRPRA